MRGSGLFAVKPDSSLRPIAGPGLLQCLLENDKLDYSSGGLKMTGSQFHKDPICGMSVEEGKAKAAGRISEYQGTPYYFCADSCKRKFDQDPERFVRKPPADR